MNRQTVLRLGMGVLGAMMLLMSSCLALIHWPHQVHSETSPDGAFLVRIISRTVFPADSWIDPPGVCIFEVRSLLKRKDQWMRFLPGGFAVESSRTVLLAREGPDCNSASLRWAPDGKEVEIYMRGSVSLTLPLVPRDVPKP
jgi:hypothetical protein